jgi:hypothetical protein
MDRSGSFQNVQVHDTPLRVMQHQSDIGKLECLRESLGEIMEEVAQIPVGRDGFGDLQEKVHPVAFMTSIMMMSETVHSHHNSIADFLREVQDYAEPNWKGNITPLSNLVKLRTRLRLQKDLFLDRP